MSDNPEFDFRYAVENTYVLLTPSSRLETFGNTMLNYHLITELMDTAQRIRVREGRLKAYRPEIVAPQALMESALEGFGQEAHAYADWLRKHEEDLMILKYGFSIKNEHMNEEIVTGSLEDIAQQVKATVTEADDPLGAVVVGVEKPWEVCLLKLMVDVARLSAPGNAHEFRSQGILTADDAQQADFRMELERDFAAAAQDARKLQTLHQKLQTHQLFNKYQDRFFALVRSHRKGR